VLVSCFDDQNDKSLLTGYRTFFFIGFRHNDKESVYLTEKNLNILLFLKVYFRKKNALKETLSQPIVWVAKIITTFLVSFL
jgi:hypothetical protein